jgi:hypothetical protein
LQLSPKAMRPPPSDWCLPSGLFAVGITVWMRMPCPTSRREFCMSTDPVLNQLEVCVQFRKMDRQLLGVVLDGDFMNSRFLGCDP